MSDLPSQGYITDAARSNSEQKVALSDVRDKVAEILGGAPSAELTLDTGGSITPPDGAGGAFFTVDTYLDVAADDLTSCVLTNLGDGGLLFLRAEHGSRVVTVKDAQGGTGQFLTQDSADFSLDALDKAIGFQRRGNDLVEIYRSYGVDSAGLRSRWNLDGGNLEAVKVLTASGTWSKPNWADAHSFVVVEVQGGGGGGGGCQNSAATTGNGGGAGGAGGYALALIPMSDLGATETVTIGAAGAGVLGNDGGSGGTTIFTRTSGSDVQVTGGAGGSADVAAAQWSAVPGGAGGAGSNGDLNFSGDAGAYGIRVGTGTQSSPIGLGGQGGSSSSRAGGQAVYTLSSSDGFDAPTGYGGGGGGAACAAGNNTNRTGGDGSPGVIIVREYR